MLKTLNGNEFFDKLLILLKGHFKYYKHNNKNNIS